MFLLKRFRFFIPLILLLCCQFVFAVTIANYADAKKQLKQGATDAVVRFTIKGTFMGLRFQNSSSDVPFGTKSIYQVGLYRDLGTIGHFDPSVDVLIGTVWSADDTLESETQEISGFTESPSVSTNYILVYSVHKEATYDKTAHVKITEITADNSTWVEVDPADAGRYVTIKASGFIYVSDSFAAIYSSSVTNIGKGMSNVPILKFALRAVDNDIVIKSIKIRNADANFPTVSGDQTKITKITLLCATANQIDEYNGTSNCKILMEATLPISGAGNSTVVNLIIPTADTITLDKASSDTDTTHDRYFFVLYDIGSGFTATKGSCALDYAEGYQSGVVTNNYVLNGTLPYGTTQFTVVAANVKMNSSSTACKPTIGVLAGQKRVKMLQVNLKITEEITAATWVIQNSKSNFYLKDEGVCKVSLYKDLTNPTLIASTSSFGSDNQTCTLNNVTMGYNPSGTDYFITYDFGLNAKSAFLTNPTSNLVESSCQLVNIKDGNAVYASFTPMPAVADSVIITASRVWVDFVSTNVTTVKPGESFQVDIGIQNISYRVDGSAGARAVYLISGQYAPKFYADDVNGNDISDEYTVTELPGPGITINAGTAGVPVTYSFLVQATNLRTNGPIVIDAQVGYRNTDMSEVYYTRHYRGNTLHPAAEKFNTNTARYAVINVSGASGKSSIYPSYIDHIEVKANNYSANKGFVNGDIVNGNSQMSIYFKSYASGSELNSMVVKLNGVELDTDDPTSFYITSQNAWIKDIGDESGEITVDGYSGVNKLDTTYIYFVTEDKFTARDLLGYPNPYNPDDGDCQIGFYMSEAGEYDIYIYDASGAEILKENDLEAAMGYNIYKWSGERKNGKKVGRGVYLVKVKAKGDSKDEIITTKIGVR